MCFVVRHVCKKLIFSVVAVINSNVTSLINEASYLPGAMLRTGRPEFDSSAGARNFFSSPSRPDWLWIQSSLLSNGQQVPFPRRKAAGAWSWPLTSVYCRS